MSQYALSLTLPPVFSAANFFVSGCNREAFSWVGSWPRWGAGPTPALYLYGPGGSGKSHLGHIWAEKAHAVMASARGLSGWMPQAGNWLIEDIEQAPDEKQLLHWFNAIREHGGSLLLTSRLSAKELPFTLPDLTSRLLALPQVAIYQPDDAVLAAAIRKQFTDRQVRVDDEVIAYLVSRMERSLARAKELVGQLDSKALAEGRTITVPFARTVLENL